MVGAYSIIWRYVSIEDIKVFLKAAAISCVVLVVLRFVLNYSDFTLWKIPISVILIDTMMAFGGLLALRILRRFVYELNEKNRVYSGKTETEEKADVDSWGRPNGCHAGQGNGRTSGR